MTTTTTKPATPAASRVLREGYGPGAWHGPDMKAALADLTDAQAFARPAPGRHSIAEVALHHAYYLRAVRGQVTGTTPEPFVLEGEDWFELPSGSPLSWADVQRAVQTEHEKLAKAIAAIEAGKRESPLGESERFDLVLGITCHAAYHAGQIQLVKKLIASL